MIVGLVCGVIALVAIYIIGEIRLVNLRRDFERDLEEIRRNRR